MNLFPYNIYSSSLFLLLLLPPLVATSFTKNCDDLNAQDLLVRPLLESRPESKSLQQIKTVLSLLKQKRNLHPMENTDFSILDTKERPNCKQVKQILWKFLNTLKRVKKKSGELKVNHAENSTKLYKWTDWSTCSVTCGKGRVIRWRHCKEGCGDLETEMEEKSCQLPECPRKLFGIIKLP